MNAHTIQVGTYEVNCTLLTLDGKLWIVDPGSEAERIVGMIRQAAIAPGGILLTHAHFDHIGGIPGLQAAFPELPVYVSPDDMPALTHPMNQMPPDYPAIDNPRNVKSAAETGISGLEVIATPGHTPGGVCYYLSEAGLLLSGDTLFAGSVGRTDFPGGDMATLMRSLEKLKALPPDTKVIPGHGMFTTIGRELAGNPFLQSI